MSIKLIDAVLDSPLRGTDRLVMIALCDAGNDQGYCYPGYSRLCRRAGVSRGTLANSLKKLKEIGLIDVEGHASFGKGKSVNTYQINVKLLKNTNELSTRINPSYTPPKRKVREPNLSENTAEKFDTPKVREPNSEKFGSRTTKSSGAEHEPSVLTVSNTNKPSVLLLGEEPPATPKKSTKEKPRQGLNFDNWPSPPSPEVWKDYLATRKAKRAQTTQTAINRMAKQLHIAASNGMSVDECLEQCCERGWAAFNWSWTDQAKNNERISEAAKTTIPDDFALTIERERICEQLAPELINDVGQIFNFFVSNARSNGRLKVDWDAAWAEWLVRKIDQHRNKPKSFQQQKIEQRRALEESLNDSSWATGLAI